MVGRDSIYLGLKTMRLGEIIKILTSALLDRQLVRASSLYARVVSSILSQKTHKNKSMNMHK